MHGQQNIKTRIRIIQNLGKALQVLLVNRRTKKK